MMGVALLPTPTDLDDFFSELDRLLGTAALALSVLGPGAGGGMALAGGAGTVAGAPEALAAAGAAAAGVGLAVLIASIVQGESPGEEFDKILHGNKIKGTPEVDPHDLAKLNREDIPPDVLKEADEAVARAKAGKIRFDKHDGKIWEDRKHQLPPKPRGYYREWTAAGPHSPRGTDRVITGGDPRNPDVIYYWDHSDSPPILIGP